MKKLSFTPEPIAPTPISPAARILAQQFAAPIAIKPVSQAAQVVQAAKAPPPAFMSQPFAVSKTPIAARIISNQADLTSHASAVVAAQRVIPAMGSAKPTAPSASPDTAYADSGYSDPGFQSGGGGEGQAQSEGDERESEDSRQTEDFQREQQVRRDRESEESSEEERYASSEEEQPAEIQTDGAEAETARDEAQFNGDIPVSAYMHNNELSCMTARLTPWGIMPATVKAKMKSQYPNGPVSVGADPVTDAAIQASKRKLLASTVDEQQKTAAESLVCRARCGDQNAMAIISLVAQNAKSSQRAHNAYMHIQRYIDANPSDGSSFGADSAVPTNTINRSAVQFAESGPLNNHRISDILNTFTGPKSRKRKIVTFGFIQFNLDEAQFDKYKQRLDNVGKALLDFGRAMGLGRAIQIVRSNGPISTLSPKASWELGE